MNQIILNDDQVKAVQAATGVVEFRDQHGKLVGYFARPPSNEEIAEAQARLNSQGPWHTTAQVMDHLDSLEKG
jgi:hypothetical protein